MDMSVSLNTTFQLNKERIVVNYVVVNRKITDIYLIDFTMDVGPLGAFFRQDHLVTSYDPPDTAVLSSVLSPLPPNTSWVTPPTVYSRKVKAGDTYMSNASAILPLRDREGDSRSGKDDRTKSREERQVICKKIRFELSSIDESLELEPRRLEIGGQEIFELNMAAWKHHHIISRTADGFQIAIITKRVI